MSDLVVFNAVPGIFGSCRELQRSHRQGTHLARCVHTVLPQHPGISLGRCLQTIPSIKHMYFTSALAQGRNRIADICIVLLQQCGLTSVFSFGLRQGSNATSVKRYRRFHCVGDLWWKCHSAQNPKSWLGQGSILSWAVLKMVKIPENP